MSQESSKQSEAVATQSVVEPMEEEEQPSVVESDAASASAPTAAAEVESSVAPCEEEQPAATAVAAAVVAMATEPVPPSSPVVQAAMVPIAAAAAEAVAVAISASAAEAAAHNSSKDEKTERSPPSRKKPKKSNGVVAVAAVSSDTDEEMLPPGKRKPAHKAAAALIELGVTKQNGAFMYKGIEIDMKQSNGVQTEGQARVTKYHMENVPKTAMSLDDIFEPLGPGDKDAVDAALKHLSSNGNFLLARVNCDGFFHGDFISESVRIMWGVGTEKVIFHPYRLKLGSAERYAVYHDRTKLNPIDAFATFLVEHQLITPPYTPAISVEPRRSQKQVLLSDQSHMHYQGILFFVDNEDAKTKKERPYVPYYHPMGEMNTAQKRHDRKNDYDKLTELKLLARMSHTVSKTDLNVITGNSNRQVVDFDIKGFDSKHTGCRSLIPERALRPRKVSKDENPLHIESRKVNTVVATEKDLCSEVLAMTEKEFVSIFAEVSDEVKATTPRKKKSVVAAASSSSSAAAETSTPKRRGRPPGVKNKPKGKASKAVVDANETESENEAESEPDSDGETEAVRMSALIGLLQGSDTKTDVALTYTFTGIPAVVMTNPGCTRPRFTIDGGELRMHFLASVAAAKAIGKDAVPYKGLSNPVSMYALTDAQPHPVMSTTIRRMNGENSPSSSSAAAASAPASQDVDAE